jgi:phosphoglucomutase
MDLNEIKHRASLWVDNNYFDQTDREQIKLWIKEENPELQEAFYKDLEFGTGGLRSIIGIGPNRINKYNIRRATQACANQIIKEFGPKQTACVAYDCRHFSFEFAKEVACVFAANGIKTFIYDHLIPVPMLSFAVRNTQSACGVMITASHNPKEYNGYKCYWADGCQVVPPTDQAIIDQYNALTNWSDIKCINFEEGMQSDKIVWMPEMVIENYFSVIKKQIKRPELFANHRELLKVVYSPLHGTGISMVKKLEETLNFKIDLVSAQSEPDPNFSTVKSPNPENPEALAMALGQLKATNADLAFGTDPDTDRLGVVYLDNGNPVYLNGNQIAVLMLDYILETAKEKNQLPKNPIVIKSIVTSELQTAICQHYAVKIYNTLTGFKWMGNLIKRLEDNNTNFDFIFASEESFGYMGHSECRDKDGISAMALMIELTLYHKVNQRNLSQALDSIYQKYGFYQESLLSIDYYGLEGQSKIKRIMEHFRNKLNGAFLNFKITKIEDYLLSTETNLKNGEQIMLDQPKSDVLGLTFEAGHKLYLRPSGTEPKIKFYTMVNQNSGSLDEMKKQASIIIEIIESEIKKLTDTI